MKYRPRSSISGFLKIALHPPIQTAKIRHLSAKSHQWPVAITIGNEATPTMNPWNQKLSYPNRESQ